MSAPIQTPFGSPIAHGEAAVPYGDHVRTPQAGDWTPEEDAALLDAIADGLSFRHAAAVVKTRSRDACIGRMFRLCNKVGEQAA